MHLGRNNPRYTYYINNDPLQSVEEHKDLGVIMDSNLKFHTHTSAVANKANQVLDLIRKSFTNLLLHFSRLLSSKAYFNAFLSVKNLIAFFPCQSLLFGTSIPNDYVQ